MHDASRPPSRDASGGAPHGGPAKLLEVVAESLWFAGTIAEIGIRQCETGDVTGLSYSVRRLTAYLRVIIETTADLVEQYPPKPSRPGKQWTEEPR